MRPTLPALTVPVLLALAAAPVASPAQECATHPAPIPAPPVARVAPRTDTLFGHARTDEYAWMRVEGSPELLAHLRAENRYADAWMAAGACALRDSILRELTERAARPAPSVPRRVGPYLYYERTGPGTRYPVYARRRVSMRGAEEVYLDLDERARGHRYYAAAYVKVDPGHRLVAFAEDTTGAEWYTLRFRDLATGRLLPERIDSVWDSGEWAADGATFLYTRADATHRADRVFRHRAGTDPAGDVQVLREDDPRFRLQVYRTRDGRYLVTRAYSVTTAEARVVPADRPDAPLRLVAPRGTGGRYHVEHRGDRFVIYTDADGAFNYKLVQAPDSAPGKEHWHDLVPHRDSVLVADYRIFRDHLVLFERRDALRPIRVLDLRTGAAREVAFPESVYTAYRGDSPEFDTDTLRFVYASPLTPTSVYDYDMRTGGRVLRARAEVPGFDPKRYATERTWARAPDGARVPVTLVYRAPLARDGRRPLLLTGYGAYAISQDAGFDAHILPLLDRGVVYAIAHVRGGQEMGRLWFEGGRLANKRNTFTDFAAAAEHLVREGYTSPARLAMRGGSAGGTLVGAVMNLRPGLFRAAVAEAPFVDVLDALLDPSRFLTTEEWEYWGDPRVPEQYAWLAAYSPYDNVRRQPYPALLATASLNDPRALVEGPARWVARLRARGTGPGPVLFRTDLEAGHHGASSLSRALKDEAFVQAFLLAQLRTP